MVYLKVVGKFMVALVAGAVGAELGFAGGAALVNDAVAISGVANPKVVAVKGVGPFKKAIVQQKNPYTGEVITVKVPVKNYAAVADKKAARK